MAKSEQEEGVQKLMEDLKSTINGIKEELERELGSFNFELEKTRDKPEHEVTEQLHKVLNKIKGVGTKSEALFDFLSELKMSMGDLLVRQKAQTKIIEDRLQQSICCGSGHSSPLTEPPATPDLEPSDGNIFITGKGLSGGYSGIQSLDTLHSADISSRGGAARSTPSKPVDNHPGESIKVSDQLPSIAKPTTPVTRARRSANGIDLDKSDVSKATISRRRRLGLRSDGDQKKNPGARTRSLTSSFKNTKNELDHPQASSVTVEEHRKHPAQSVGIESSHDTTRTGNLPACSNVTGAMDNDDSLQDVACIEEAVASVEEVYRSKYRDVLKSLKIQSVKHIHFMYEDGKENWVICTCKSSDKPSISLQSLEAVRLSVSPVRLEIVNFNPYTIFGRSVGQATLTSPALEELVDLARQAFDKWNIEEADEEWIRGNIDLEKRTVAPSKHTDSIDPINKILDIVIGEYKRAKRHKDMENFLFMVTYSILSILKSRFGAERVESVIKKRLNDYDFELEAVCMCLHRLCSNPKVRQKYAGRTLVIMLSLCISPYTFESVILLIPGLVRSGKTIMRRLFRPTRRAASLHLCLEVMMQALDDHVSPIEETNTFIKHICCLLEGLDIEKSEIYIILGSGDETQRSEPYPTPKTLPRPRMTVESKGQNIDRWKSSNSLVIDRSGWSDLEARIKIYKNRYDDHSSSVGQLLSVVETLKPGSWITGTAIDTVVEDSGWTGRVMPSHFLQASFYVRPLVDLLMRTPAMERVLVPVCRERHWVVLDVHIGSSEIDFYDSNFELLDYEPICRQGQSAVEIALALAKIEKVDKRWTYRTFVAGSKTPLSLQQEDVDNCGIYVLNNIRCLMNGVNPRADFSPNTLRVSWADRILHMIESKIHQTLEDKAGAAPVDNFSPALSSMSKNNVRYCTPESPLAGKAQDTGDTETKSNGNEGTETHRIATQMTSNACSINSPASNHPSIENLMNSDENQNGSSSKGGDGREVGSLGPMNEVKIPIKREVERDPMNGEHLSKRYKMEDPDESDTNNDGMRNPMRLDYQCGTETEGNPETITSSQLSPDSTAMKPNTSLKDSSCSSEDHLPPVKGILPSNTPECFRSDALVRGSDPLQLPNPSSPSGLWQGHDVELQQEAPTRSRLQSSAESRPAFNALMMSTSEHVPTDDRFKLNVKSPEIRSFPAECRGQIESDRSDLSALGGSNIPVEYTSSGCELDLTTMNTDKGTTTVISNPRFPTSEDPSVSRKPPPELPTESLGIETPNPIPKVVGRESAGLDNGEGSQDCLSTSNTGSPTVGTSKVPPDPSLTRKGGEEVTTGLGDPSVSFFAPNGNQQDDNCTSDQADSRQASVTESGVVEINKQTQVTGNWDTGMAEMNPIMESGGKRKQSRKEGFYAKRQEALSVAEGGDRQGIDSIASEQIRADTSVQTLLSEAWDAETRAATTGDGGKAEMVSPATAPSIGHLIHNSGSKRFGSLEETPNAVRMTDPPDGVCTRDTGNGDINGELLNRSSKKYISSIEHDDEEIHPTLESATMSPDQPSKPPSLPDDTFASTFQHRTVSNSPIINDFFGVEGGEEPLTNTEVGRTSRSQPHAQSNSEGESDLQVPKGSVLDGAEQVEIRTLETPAYGSIKKRMPSFDSSWPAISLEEKSSEEPFRDRISVLQTKEQPEEMLNREPATINVSPSTMGDMELVTSMNMMNSPIEPILEVLPSSLGGEQRSKRSKSRHHPSAIASPSRERTARNDGSDVENAVGYRQSATSEPLPTSPGTPVEASLSLCRAETIRVSQVPLVERTEYSSEHGHLLDNERSDECTVDTSEQAETAEQGAMILTSRRSPASRDPTICYLTSRDAPKAAHTRPGEAPGDESQELGNSHPLIEITDRDSGEVVNSKPLEERSEGRISSPTVDRSKSSLTEGSTRSGDSLTSYYKSDDDQKNHDYDQPDSRQALATSAPRHEYGVCALDQDSARTSAQFSTSDITYIETTAGTKTAPSHAESESEKVGINNQSLSPPNIFDQSMSHEKSEAGSSSEANKGTVDTESDSSIANGLKPLELISPMDAKLTPNVDYLFQEDSEVDSANGRLTKRSKLRRESYPVDSDMSVPMQTPSLEEGLHTKPSTEGDADETELELCSPKDGDIILRGMKRKRNQELQPGYCFESSARIGLQYLSNDVAATQNAEDSYPLVEVTSGTGFVTPPTFENPMDGASLEDTTSEGRVSDEISHKPSRQDICGPATSALDDGLLSDEYTTPILSTLTDLFSGDGDPAWPAGSGSSIPIPNFRANRERQATLPPETLGQATPSTSAPASAPFHAHGEQQGSQASKAENASNYGQFEFPSTADASTRTSHPPEQAADSQGKSNLKSPPPAILDEHHLDNHKSPGSDNLCYDQQQWNFQDVHGFGNLPDDQSLFNWWEPAFEESDNGQD